MWKRILLSAIVVFAVVWGVRVLWTRHTTKQEAARRDVEFQAALASAKRSIPVGTSRGSLRAFVKSQNLTSIETQFNGAGSNDLLVELGREPSRRWFCDYDGVYLDFKFPAESHRRSDTDSDAALQSIDIFRWSRDCH